MSESCHNLFEAASRQLHCTELDKLFRLAVTHTSASEPSAQLVLSYLGICGAHLALVWHHLRLGSHRDSSVLTDSLGEFERSHAWVDAFADEDTLSRLRLGGGMQHEEPSYRVKRQFLYAVLGACFFADTANACEIAIDCLAPFFRARTDGGNPKGRLQEYSQNKYSVRPVYTAVAEYGSDHKIEFVVEVHIPGLRRRASGHGRNKKAAEHAAAEAFLQSLGRSPRRVRRIPSHTDRTSWTLAKWLKGVSRPALDRTNITQLVHAFEDATGIQLAAELAEIAVVHPSIRRSPGPFGGKGNGLTILGNCVLPASMYECP